MRLSYLKSFFLTKKAAIISALIILLAVMFYLLNGITLNEEAKTVLIPSVGAELDIKTSSLLLAAILIGLLDGFNPCAMWVLIYLITLVSGLEEQRRKMWFIVGTFLMASGILYFVILAGWLNLFLLLGFSNWILYGVGLFAIGTGMYSLYDFYRKGGQIICEVGDVKSRKKTMNRIKEIVHSPITIGSVIATIALAFAINTIEFVCSAGLPAIFTQMLAIAGIDLLAKYFYMFIYVLAFMFDDIIIFTLAFYAINSDTMEKYSGLSKLLGGIIMIGIGVILLFFPGLLA